jgi:hypothetical protein
MNINDAKTYQSIILLNEMINNGRKFKTILNGDDKMLEQLFISLLAKGYVGVEGDCFYATQSGINVLSLFEQRYKEYLKLYDIFAFVDTEAGEFAFERYFDFDTDEEWDEYKNQERFFDVRIAVAKLKHMNVHELIFMSFINSNRFDTHQTGWQFDVMTDRIWAEIDDICREAITIDDLGADVVKNIIKRGTEIMMEITRQEIERKKQELEQARTVDAGVDEDVEYIEETTVIIEEYEEDLVYYEPYYDPFFVSAIWLAPLFIW